MKNTYMLDICICSFIMREQPPRVLDKLQQVSAKHRIVISAITYAEMQYGVIGKKASPKHALLVSEFVKRLDAILPWGAPAIDATVSIKKYLASKGMPIGNNDTAIAGHAISEGCILVSNNTREFQRVPNLSLEDWLN